MGKGQLSEGIQPFFLHYEYAKSKMSDTNKVRKNNSQCNFLPKRKKRKQNFWNYSIFFLFQNISIAHNFLEYRRDVFIFHTKIEESLGTTVKIFHKSQQKVIW